MPKFNIRLTRYIDTYVTVQAPDADKALQVALANPGEGDQDPGDTEVVFCHKASNEAEVDLTWEEADEQ